MSAEAEIGRIGPAAVYDIFPGSDTAYSNVVGIAVCGSAGNVVVKRVDGTQLTIPMLAGQILPIALSQIIASGTTATSVLVMRSK